MVRVYFKELTNSLVFFLIFISSLIMLLILRVIPYNIKSFLHFLFAYSWLRDNKISLRLCWRLKVCSLLPFIIRILIIVRRFYFRNVFVWALYEQIVCLPLGVTARGRFLRQPYTIYLQHNIEFFIYYLIKLVK
jgi:hypothetical protein